MDSYSINNGGADSIAVFCKKHHISRSAFYDLPPEDKPRTFHVGKRVLISHEAQAEWRRRMEEKSSREGAA